MKQTAIDWLVDQVENFNCMKLGLIPSNIIEKAKEMEKEQIQDAYWDGIFHGEFLDGEGYYNYNYGEL